MVRLVSASAPSGLGYRSLSDFPGPTPPLPVGGRELAIGRRAKKPSAWCWYRNPTQVVSAAIGLR
eukprot:2677862-Rhodomonas_salina.1